MQPRQMEGQHAEQREEKPHDEQKEHPFLHR